MEIRITIGDEVFPAELNDSATAEAIAAALPIDGSVNRWGDEFYFSIPVDVAEANDSRSEFEIGELGYWPPGNAFCIFFGPTPASHGGEPRMANPGNPFGRITDSIEALTSVPDGSPVRVEAD